MTSGNHHLAKAVHQLQTLAVHLKQAVCGSTELDFALLDLGFIHIFIFADVAEDASSIVFVEHIFVSFPHVKVLLADGK